MSNLLLNQQKLQQSLDLYKEYSKSENYQKDILDRQERKQFFKNLLRQDFDEAVFAEIIKKLWASQIFVNKDYLVNKIIRDNGIEKLKDNFKDLMTPHTSSGILFATFLNNIKGMGPAMVSELLCHLDPENSGIWNNKARSALEWLEVKNIPTEKYKLSAEEYDSFNLFLKEIASILTKSGHRDIDLLTVDYFLWEVWEKLSRKEEKKPEITEKTVKSTSRHDELIAKIEQIGLWLGFEVETEKSIAIGARVDVVWQARIANLGSVSYIFEVQDKGSVDSLIVNLQRSQVNSSVQKLIVVSDSAQIEKIKREVETMPEIFRKDCAYWEDREIDSTHEKLEQVSASISKLNLVNT